MSLPEHFARMVLVYEDLLDLIRVEEYEDATEILKKPLSDAIFSAYIDLHSKKGSATVDLFEFLGGLFIYDSQGINDDEAASRVVGAFGVAQEQLSLGQLIVRLREQRGAGVSTKQTLELIDYTLFAKIDAASLGYQLRLYHSIATALDVQRKGIIEIFDMIALRSNYIDKLSYLSARLLRSLSLLIGKSVPFKSLVGPPPKQGDYLPGAYWSSLRELIEVADRDLPEASKAELADGLVSFIITITKDLKSQLLDPTGQLLDRVERYVCPLVDIGGARPRNYRSQRWRRIRKPIKHPYDLGHFLPHSAGGPKDINLFIQERDLNRGWSAQGRRYRWVEELASASPGTFYFVRPVYEDLSPIPRYLEWGVLVKPALAKQLRGKVEHMPDTFVVGPEPKEAKLSWLISIFENFSITVHQDFLIAAVD